MPQEQMKTVKIGGFAWLAIVMTTAYSCSASINTGKTVKAADATNTKLSALQNAVTHGAERLSTSTSFALAKTNDNLADISEILRAQAAANAAQTKALTAAIRDLNATVGKITQEQSKLFAQQQALCNAFGTVATDISSPQAQEAYLVAAQACGNVPRAVR